MLLGVYAYSIGREYESSVLGGQNRDQARRDESHGGPLQPTRHEPRRGDESTTNTPSAVLQAENAVVRITTDLGIGSGFVIDRRGIVVTNHHVVEDATEATVTFNTGREFRVARILRNLPTKDLAFLLIDRPPAGLPVLSLSEQLPSKGEMVWAFGSPLGLDFSLTRGDVSNLHGDEEITLIQISTPLSPGNSGGPLLNRHGKVVGVNTLASQEGVQNLNFAVSSVDVQRALRQANLRTR